MRNSCASCSPIFGNGSFGVLISLCPSALACHGEVLLSSHINDQDRMDEVSDSLSANLDHRIFPENPLMLGFYLDCVRNGKLANTTSCSCWIKVWSCTLNMERQCVLYK